jgi:GT2 family glycosyltransferase
LAGQSLQPAEIVVVDASDDLSTYKLCADRVDGLLAKLRWEKAGIVGAAAQRNQGVILATRPFILFFDDDILFEPECVSRLWLAIQSDERLGGVNAMIVNQKYAPPGFASRTVFRLLNGRKAASYSGRVIGPAVNLLPEDREDLPPVVPVEWLNTTCALYRREALPEPPFDSVFTGYSMMEDLTLSLRVGKKWRLANARTARIFHNSQPGSHKANPGELATMNLINRHYVMTEILGRRLFVDYLKLMLWEIFQLLVCIARPQSRPKFWAIWWGKYRGALQIRAARRG